MTSWQRKGDSRRREEALQTTKVRCKARRKRSLEVWADPAVHGLEDSTRSIARRALRVLGFPANEFGAQEPGSNEEIAAFCTTNYNVSFDMFSKVVVEA